MSHIYSPAPHTTSHTRILLLAVWFILTFSAVAFVVTYTTNAPYADEWEFVPTLVGEEPILPWLWQQHNEHRLPLSRILFYLPFAMTQDFRTGSLVQVIMLSALALALMNFAARLRGRPSWPDVFFPVSLLHLGHWENFIMGYQVCFVLFAVFMTALVVTALQTTRATAFRSGALACVLVLLLAMTGGSGLPVAMPVIVWVMFLAWTEWHKGNRKHAVALIAMAALPIIYCSVYFISYERPLHHPPTSRDPVAIAIVAGETLAMSVGISVASNWPAMLAGILVIGVATILHILRTNPTDRTATTGLLAVAAGICGLAVAIGIGRAPLGLEMGLWSRYSLLTWPLLAAMYLVWVKASNRWVPIALAVAVILALPGNMITGVTVARDIQSHYIAIEADAKNGMSAEQLVANHFPHSPNEGQIERALVAIPILRHANVGIFSGQGQTRSELWRPLAVILAPLIAVLMVRWLWHLGRAVLAERARELFRLQHERYEELLLRSASATGLPRGLIWAKCVITGDAVLVRDTVNRGIVALVPVLIEFEPEVGTDFEDNPAAREPRPATAVFTFQHKGWETSGRVIFNHSPEQAIARFAPQFRMIDHGHH